MAAAIGSSAQQLKLRTGMDVDVQCDEFDKRFAGDVESMFFRITQEALRNCAKHANAKSVEIRLARSAEWIKLTIADDGVGFELDRLEQFANAGGLGLSTMRERAEFAGAQFEITSSSAHGTRIRVWLESDKAFGAAP
ncbi:MAG TPA: ATP-binding protein [Burkholderiaceae bacterium]|nr:ATP-binding protein [Burkholderiaceae bacterium]